MGMRAAVIDRWLSEKLSKTPESPVLHIGCGLDSRIERVNKPFGVWFDTDLPEVVEIRKKYYSETDTIKFSGETEMTPEEKINELSGFEKAFFKAIFAGKFAKNFYKIYTYEK